MRHAAGMATGIFSAMCPLACALLGTFFLGGTWLWGRKREDRTDRQKRKRQHLSHYSLFASDSLHGVTMPTASISSSISTFRISRSCTQRHVSCLFLQYGRRTPFTSSPLSWRFRSHLSCKCPPQGWDDMSCVAWRGLLWQPSFSGDNDMNNRQFVTWHVHAQKTKTQKATFPKTKAPCPAKRRKKEQEQTGMPH